MGSRSKLPPTKDLCVYLVEAGGLQESGISDEIVTLVRKCIQDKIFSENQDDICIARADMTKNYEFGPVSWESFKKVESVFRKPKSKNANPVASLRTVCESMSLQSTEDTYTLKKVLFFCDLTTIVTESEVKSLKKRLEDENICISFIVPNSALRTEIQKNNVNILQRILIGSNFVITTYDEATTKIANTLNKKQTRPSPWNVSMEIGRDIKFNVAGFVSIRQNKVQELSKGYLKDVKSSLPRNEEENQHEAVSSMQNEQLGNLNQTDTTWKDRDGMGTSVKQEVELAKNVIQTDTTWKEKDGTFVEEEKVGSAYYYGDKLVPYNELEQEDAYESGDKCLKVLVFCPRDLIKPCYLVGDGVTLFYPRDREVIAALHFNALLRVLDKTNKVAIVRKVYLKNSRAVLGVLLPNMEKKCLTFAELCFADDTSIPDFPLLVKNTSSDDDGLVEKDQLIDDFISAKSLSFPFVPAEGPVDPSVQKLRDTIACKILGEIELSGKNANNNERQDNVDLYFKTLFEKEMASETLEKLTSAFPVKVNVVDEERASGANIFKKREMKNEENGAGGKKPKIEEPVKLENQMEDEGGIDADELLDLL